MAFGNLAFVFIPIFVAVDVFGLLPIYLGLTGDLSEKERRPLAVQATATAAGVGVGFVLVGDWVLGALGATVADLQIAGGILLLVFAVHDLVHPELPLRQPDRGLGVMPLGVPLIAGPAVLTTLLTLARTHGRLATTVAFALNLAIVWLALRSAAVIRKTMGTAGCQAFAKVSNLLLAAIGVTFIRRGVIAVLGLAAR